MDLQKEMQICSKEFEEKWDVFCEAHGSRHNKSVAKYFFFASWQQAKAWVVPEGFVLVERTELECAIDALKWASTEDGDLCAKQAGVLEDVLKAQELTND